jgi:hypothetical protein
MSAPHSSCNGIPNTGRGIYNVWDPDLPPINPHPVCDEFDLPFLHPKWIGVNLSSLTTYDVNKTVPDALYMQSAGISNTIVAAVQNAPAGDFTIYTKPSMATVAGTTINVRLGLILSTNAAAGAGSQYTLGFTRSSNGDYLDTYPWTNFNSPGSGVASYPRQMNYLAIYRSGTNYYAGWSNDGKTWTWSSISPGFTAAYFGLFINCYAATRSDYSFEFFRYFPSSQIAPPGGIWPGPASLGNWKSTLLMP